MEQLPLKTSYLSEKKLWNRILPFRLCIQILLHRKSTFFVCFLPTVFSGPFLHGFWEAGTCTPAAALQSYHAAGFQYSLFFFTTKLAYNLFVWHTFWSFTFCDNSLLWIIFVAALLYTLVFERSSMSRLFTVFSQIRHSFHAHILFLALHQTCSSPLFLLLAALITCRILGNDAPLKFDGYAVQAPVHVMPLPKLQLGVDSC